MLIVNRSTYWTFHMLMTEVLYDILPFSWVCSPIDVHTCKHAIYTCMLSVVL